MVLQDLVEGARFLLVAALGVAAAGGRLDRPAVALPVAFAPPAIQHRQVDHAVHAGLHARSAGGLQRIDRIVEPDIDAGDQPARKAQVIAFHEQDLPFELGQLRDARDLADQVLAGHVGGVRATREDEQHRPLRIAGDRPQPVEILEQQRRALVGGEAAREADGEHVGVVRVRVAQDAIQMRLAAAGCGNAGRESGRAPHPACSTSGAGAPTRTDDPGCGRYRAIPRCSPTGAPSRGRDSGRTHRTIRAPGTFARARRW